MSGILQVLANNFVGVFSTWNPSDKDADIALSGGNLVATQGAGGQHGAVRSTLSRPATDHAYFEVTLSGVDKVQLVGLGNASATINQYPGTDVNGWSYYANNGNKVNNNVLTAYGTSLATVVGVELNNGTLIFWLDGVSQGNAFTGLTGNLFPMWGPGSVTAGPRVGTLKVGATAFTYPLPSGAAPWV